MARQENNTCPVDYTKKMSQKILSYLTHLYSTVQAKLYTVGEAPEKTRETRPQEISGGIR